MMKVKIGEICEVNEEFAEEFNECLTESRKHKIRKMRPEKDEFDDFKKKKQKADKKDRKDRKKGRDKKRSD